MRILSLGHAIFAITMIAVGILGLVHGDFAAIWQGAPKALPGREALAYLCATVSLPCGLGLLVRRTSSLAARVLWLYLLLWFLLFKLRFIFIAPLVEVSYQSCGEHAVLLAGAWVLFAWLATDLDRRWLGFATGCRGIRIAQALFGLALVAFGLSHFVYVQFTAPLVPDWLPWHLGWAYFTGIAYLAAGVAILTGVFARLAAALATVQMGVFMLLVWVPRLAAGHVSERHWTESVVTWALVAAAWVVTDSYRDKRWFAARPQHSPATHQ